MENPLQIQVGGEHYKQFPIQPIEIRHMLNLNGTQSDILTYVMRHKYKNGIEDLKKALHHCELAIHNFSLSLSNDHEITNQESAIIKVVSHINNMTEEEEHFFALVVSESYFVLRNNIKEMINKEYTNPNNQ